MARRRYVLLDTIGKIIRSPRRLVVPLESVGELFQPSQSLFSKLGTVIRGHDARHDDDSVPLQICPPLRLVDIIHGK